MKKLLMFSGVVMMLLSGCGDTVITLNDVTKNGLTKIENGMTKSQVEKILKKEPDTIQKVGNYELWIYEGEVTDKNNEDLKRYKNFTVKFKNGKVDYTGYFGCKLAKVED